MKHFLCCLALLCLFFNTTAQSSQATNTPIPNTQQPTTKGLSIGDTVPDVGLSDITNTPDSHARLSDYKGQLLILDFWATWCSPCLAMFPKTDSLNNQFKGAAVILPVTYQTKEEVAKLFNKSSRLKAIHMPIVVNDKSLHSLFPHNELPHYVWIDATGIVCAITDHKAITATNITAMLNNTNIAMEEKKDAPILPYNSDLPLLFNAVEFAPHDLKYACTFTAYKEGFASRMDIKRYPDKSIARLTVTNYGLKDLYAFAYTSDYGIYSSQIIIDIKNNSAPLIYPDYKTSSKATLRQWEKDNLVCYELLMPNTLAPSFCQFMREDLARIYPQYKASFEKRNTRMLALVRTSSVDKLKSTGGQVNLVSDPFELSITNYPIAVLFNILNSKELSHLKIPVINETGISGNIDLHLKGQLSDVESLRTELKKYDLDLVYKVAPTNMLVITDAN